MSDLVVAPGEPIVVVATGPPGVAGVTVELVDLADTVVVPTSGGSIVESDPGVYIGSIVAGYPQGGDYIAVMRMPGRSPAATRVTVTSVPTPPGAASPGMTGGPCQAWCTSADVQARSGASTTDYTAEAWLASELLYNLSARRFPGACSQTVRPCRTLPGCWWAGDVLPGGHVAWAGDGWAYGGPVTGDRCGCGVLSRVRLAGPVRAVSSVVVDGTVLGADAYRVDEARWLTRTDGGAWPACQNLAAADSAPGAFAVTYTSGEDPPSSGKAAAVELALELYKASHPGSGVCALPEGTVSVNRQGLTVQRAAQPDVRARLRLVPSVAAFLDTYNPNAAKLPTIVYTPDVQEPARRLA